MQQRRHIAGKLRARRAIVAAFLRGDAVTAEAIACTAGVSIDRAAAELRAVFDLRSGIATQPAAGRGAVNDSFPSVSLTWRAVLQGAARLFSGRARENA